MQKLAHEAKVAEISRASKFVRLKFEDSALGEVFRNLAASRPHFGDIVLNVKPFNFRPENWEKFFKPKYVYSDINP